MTAPVPPLAHLLHRLAPAYFVGNGFTADGKELVVAGMPVLQKDRSQLEFGNATSLPNQKSGL